MIEGALAAVHCELFDAMAIGDHTVIVGEVSEGRGSGRPAPR